MAKRKPKNHYGEGSIFYSNVKQKWMAQINVGKDENGKVIRKSVTTDTQEEVWRNMLIGSTYGTAHMYIRDNMVFVK